MIGWEQDIELQVTEPFYLLHIKLYKSENENKSLFWRYRLGGYQQIALIIRGIDKMPKRKDVGMEK